MNPSPAPETFAQLWNQSVRVHGSRTFLTFHHPETGVVSWTYAEFDVLIMRVANALIHRGVGSGDAVHVALKNSPAFVAIWLAAARLGAWIVPVDPASSARDIASQIKRTSPVVGFYGLDRQSAYLDGATGLLTSTVGLTETSGDTDPASELIALTSARTDEHSHRTEPIPQGADRLAVMFTSGTTSEPKGVCLTQRNYVHLSTTMSKLIDLTPEHRWFVTLPLFHGNAQFYCFGPAIAVGASVALTSAFSASKWFEQAHELKVTHTSLFAAPIRMILARRPDDAPRLDLQHVWFAQSLGAEHYCQFAEYVGCAPRQLYGMTETIAVATADLSAHPRHDVIGRPAGGRHIELVEPMTLRPVEARNPGMIMVEGTRGVDLFESYLDDPETTERSFVVEDGRTWFRTGDLAEADRDGVMRFVGRIDDVIKVSGENVSLTEVEAALAQIPGVLEVAVLPKPDPVRDQVPVAFVVAKNQASPPQIAELQQWAEEHLAPQARPREWTLIDELPRTSVGKVRRFKMASDNPASSNL
ncbi:class I adenylate-forming enzyme family protein [Rhodococcus erythropolis]|uniref:class I adenylate-forming enzyme family protein n=1 Tax=Rhodococcus erythropolis TaxID=1833 RepID=UPI002225E9A6|nr:class I adenylate-forming enzyme family protein [Rhodococcus erythropolis]MCW2295376.1 crotonobetaine/carnitine-CoA ligase [Rhodococcus erythropolis]